MKHDAAALIAATHVHADYEDDEWEPVTDLDHFKVCESRDVCARVYELCIGFKTTPYEATDTLKCATCPHFEDTGFGPS